MFQIREEVGCLQMFFKLGVLKNFAKISQISQENACVGVYFE